MALWTRLLLLAAALRAAAGQHTWISYCGYGVEWHKITTKDGYKLTAFRLKSDVSGVAMREPVLLQHRIGTNGDSWFWLRRNSLPCVLARIGYDVWVANSRGTKYSREHTEHTKFSTAFWSFTLHEIAVYDLPATIDYILRETGRYKLSYVGHGVGGALVFILLSQHRIYNDKVTVAVTFAPVCYADPDILVRYIAGAFVFLRDKLEKWFSKAILFEKFLNGTLNKMADDDKFYLQALETFDFVLNERRSLEPYYIWDWTSIRAYIHYCQIIFTERFTRYDYGPDLNWITYDSRYPPTYRFQLKRITTPQFIIYSNYDSVVTWKGVRKLIGYLPKNVGKSYKVLFFNHNDYLLSRYAKQYVYDIAVREMNRYLNTTTPNPECLVFK